MTHRVYHQHLVNPLRLNEVAKRAIFKPLALALLILSGEGQAQTLSGTWSGGLEGPNFWGGLELTLDHPGKVWVAQARLQIDGRLHSEPVTDISIKDSKIDFRTTWEGREVRLSGDLEGDRLRGSLTLASASPQDQLLRGRLDLLRLSPSSSSPGVTLPAPTGPYAIGRTTFHWVDENRDEALTLSRSDKRELLVHLWYPTEQRGGRSPYLPDADKAVDHLPKGLRKPQLGSN